MAREDDFDRGLRNRRAVLGDEWVDAATGRSTGFDADFQAFITRYAWHEVWGRPGLPRQTRQLLVLAITASLGRWDEFDLHARAAVRCGVPLEVLRETLIHTAIYAGVPAANTAFKRLSQLLREAGLLPGPQPLTAGVRVVRHRTFSQPQLQVALQGPGAGSPGARAPIVLAHALGLDHTMWDDLALRLAAAGHPVLRYDHRGQGGSALGAGPGSMDALVDDAARVLTEWGAGPVVFIGLSMGGMVGMELAARHPQQVRALGVANSTARLASGADAVWRERMAAVRAGGVEALADATMERFFTAAWRKSRPTEVARWREVLTRTDPAGYLAACEAVMGLDAERALSAIACPVLVIAGAHDTGTTPQMSDAIAAGLPGGARRITLDAAHLSALEQPDAFAAAVLDWLGSL